MKQCITPIEIASWYHSKILRIQHGKQNPTKQYLSDDQVLDLFDGTVCIQEKVDGKMTCNTQEKSITLIEDMTGKMEYSALPDNKRIVLDEVNCKVNFNDLSITAYRVLHVSNSDLDYAFLILESPSFQQIYELLDALSHSKSHFGSNVIEGLVIKNYDKQLFGKWINDGFEDKLGD